MKAFKKIFAAVLMGMMAAAMSASTFAESESANDRFDNYLNNTLPQILSEETVNILDIIREYASQTIPYYLPTFELYSEYSVSEPIQIHNWGGGADTEKYLVIVSKDNVMVGSLTAEYVESRVISAFRAESIPTINEALASGAEIQLGYCNNCFLVYSQSKMSVVDNPYLMDESFADELAIDSALSETIRISEITSASIQTRTGSWSVSGVKNVDNQTNSDNGKGLCWAACIASMGMQKNRSAAYTAKSIYESCRDSTDSNRPSGDYPIGNSKWINFGLEYVVNITPVQTSALSSESVKVILKQNKPILVYLRNENDDKGHGMVLYSHTEIDSSHGQYVFMDPSKGSGVLSVMIDGSVMKDGTNITLTCRSGGYYDYWQYSFYES